MATTPTVNDVEAAMSRIRPHVTETPLWPSSDLSERSGATVFLKLESLQRTGSFKIRGALNRLTQLSEVERARGVIAWSSGNHAQGVALAARLVGTTATIVMPSDAPAIKTAGTLRLGAKIVPYDRVREDREAIARRIAAEHGLTIVPAFDDPDVIAGQGTIGLEIVRQMAGCDATIDDVYVPVSGGGLIAGIATAILAHIPKARIFSVEPVGYDDHLRSLAAGHKVRNSSASRALCDGLLAPEPGRLTWDINRRALAGGLAVSEEEVRAAVAFAFHRLKIVVEPSGAVGLAALLSPRHQSAGRTAIAVVTGGNVDPLVFSDCIVSSANN